MKKLYIIIAFGGFVGLLAGCSSSVQTTIIPQANGVYQAVTTAENSSDAQQGAIQKATATCQQQGKRLVVLKNKTQYQGSGKELGAISKAVHDAAFMNGGAFVPSTQSDTDYKTTVKFKCQ